MVVSSYQDLFLSETERMVVDYAEQHDYTIWKTPKEIMETPHAAERNENECT
jgi:hypothetical protein